MEHPLNKSILGGKPLTFVHGSIVANKAKFVKTRLRIHISDFISRSDLTLAFTGRNPLHHQISIKVEEKVRSEPLISVRVIKKFLIPECNTLSTNEVRAAVGAWRSRLQLCVAARGSNSEM